MKRNPNLINVTALEIQLKQDLAKIIASCREDLAIAFDALVDFNDEDMLRPLDAYIQDLLNQCFANIDINADGVAIYVGTLSGADVSLDVKNPHIEIDTLNDFADLPKQLAVMDAFIVRLQNIRQEIADRLANASSRKHEAESHDQNWFGPTQPRAGAKCSKTGVGRQAVNGF